MNTGHAREAQDVDEQQIRARMRVEELGDEHAVRDQERRMALTAREMEREVRQLEDAEKEAEAEIEEEWRGEHWGHEPVRPPAWKVADAGSQDQGSAPARPQ